MIKKHLPAINSLRDVSIVDLQQFGTDLPPVIRNRVDHVVRENERVLACWRALQSNDLPSIARLMAESHASLRDLYQVSCPELDLMVELSQSLPGFAGARMTGGGFGGCTVNLVHTSAASQFAAQLAAAYHHKTQVHPDVYICSATRGAHLEPI